ncbi:hypothetical protein YW7DRAFT_07047 [Streptomyces sp. AmelKG-E11A]|nr:hypothetical protein YW7DRAFT_07047 [Streptomyces sp. AmelKG-E11A]
MYKRMLRSVLATFSVVVAAGALGVVAGSQTAHADTGWGSRTVHSVPDTGWGPVAPAKAKPAGTVVRPADTGWGNSAPTSADA